jgi:exosortase
MASAVDRLTGEGVPAPPPARIPWIPMGVVFALLVLCYFPVLKHLVWQWENDADMGHGFFVPVIAAYIAWQRRDKVLATPVKPNYWGLLLIAWGALQLIVGMLGVELFLQRTAFLISLVGAILTIGGTAVVRALAFPLFLLIFMIPIPAIVYTQITFPLQLFASRVAESVLALLGIPVLRDGNVLELASQKLSVVEACSGIRSLLSLTFLSLVYAYFFDSKKWMRAALFLATIPIAILANAGRVTITGILSEWRTDLAQGFFHSVEGWIIFIVAMIFMIITHQVINLIYRAAHGQGKHA